MSNLFKPALPNQGIDELAACMITRNAIVRGEVGHDFC